MNMEDQSGEAIHNLQLALGKVKPTTLFLPHQLALAQPGLSCVHVKAQFVLS